MSAASKSKIRWLVSYPLPSAVSEIKRDANESRRDFAKRLVTAGLWEKAEQIYCEEILLSTPDATLHTNRSLCLFKIGRFQESARDAQRAVQIDPSFAKGFYRLACALVAIKSFKRALDAATSGLALAPEDASLLNVKREASEGVQRVDGEIYGALLNVDASGSRLPASVWRRILDFSGVSSDSAVAASCRLVCTLWNHLTWSLHTDHIETIAARPWRLGHRVPHLRSLHIRLRHSMIEADWKTVVATILTGGPDGPQLAQRFPSLRCLTLSPTVAGLQMSQLWALAESLQRDQFDDAEELEQALQCPTQRISLADLGRAPPHLLLHLISMLPPEQLPSNLHAMHVTGLLGNLEDDHFRPLAKTSVMELKIKADKNPDYDGSGFSSRSGCRVSDKICEYFPATLERLKIKCLAEFEFPTSKLPKGLQYLSVKEVFFRHGHLQGLPSSLQSLKLDLSITDADEKDRCSITSLNLIGAPKRLTRFVLIEPPPNQRKPDYQVYNVDKISPEVTFIRIK